MEKHFLVASLLISVMVLVAFSTSSCQNGKETAEDNLIGTWENQSLGETGEDIITTTINIKENSIVTFTVVSDLDNIPEEFDMHWKLEGGKFFLAFMDFDHDSIPDSEDQLEWSEWSYGIHGKTLTFSVEGSSQIIEYVRK